MTFYHMHHYYLCSYCGCGQEFHCTLHPLKINVNAANINVNVHVNAANINVSLLHGFPFFLLVVSFLFSRHIKIEEWVTDLAGMRKIKYFVLNGQICTCLWQIVVILIGQSY
jgi:hypothetical protein